MINVQPFIDKLDRLGEYMDMKIDNKGSILTIDWEWMHKITLEAAIDIYKQTGHMMYAHPEKHQQPISRKLTFEEWLNINPKE